MNEYERRFLEITENHVNFVRALKEAGGGNLVEYKGYSTQFGALANGVPQQALIAIEADAHFVLQYISASVILPNGSTYGQLAVASSAANILLHIQDTGNGENLMNQPVPAALAAGTPLPGMTGIPFLMPVPRVILPNTNVKIEVQNLGFLAVDNPLPVAVFVTLNGARVQAV